MEGDEGFGILILSRKAVVDARQMPARPPLLLVRIDGQTGGTASTIMPR
jgi:hypothetical protein